jgi:hypothetical protein
MTIHCGPKLFCNVIFFFCINNVQFFVVAAANIDLQRYFAFGCNCCG